MRDVLERYVQEAEIAERTQAKLRHQLNRWERYSSAQTVDEIDADSLIAFRMAAKSDGLSPRTIEDTINDVLLLVRSTGRDISPGRRLKSHRKAPVVPALDSFAAAYGQASVTSWPINSMSRSPEVFDGLTNADIWRAFLVVGYWTGLRLDDLCQLEWSHVKADRIERNANKTGKAHCFPMSPIVAYHLDRIRQDESPNVFPFAKWSKARIRRELRAMCDAAGVEHLTPQMIRRLAITQWACASPEAGRIVHGERLGVLSYYYDQHRILNEAGSRFEWPDVMRRAAGLSVDVETREEALKMLRHMSVDRVRDLIQIGKALR